ncbi:MAG: hypothetical protein ABSB70_00520 [Candidatus Velthaea sp.]|jgi:hypothetical protein
MPLLGLAFALLGVTLGSPAAELRAKFGDPLLVERVSAISRTADYLRADDPSAVLRITERDGVVFAVEIERERPEPTAGIGDGYGILLGMARSAVEAKRSGKPAVETMNTLIYPEDPNDDASTIYRFDGDILEGIKLIGSGSSAAGNPSLPHLAEATGAGYADAILDFSASVLVSDHFRDRYLIVHGCDTSGRRSTIDRRDGRTYAVTSATCNDKPRTFYFDISRAQPH